MTSNIFMPEKIAKRADRHKLKGAHSCNIRRAIKIEAI